MAITLTDRERQLIALAEEVSGAAITDCVVEDGGRVVFVVATGDMATAIGPDGRTVRRIEDRLDREVRLVEDADRAEDFVANALAPAAVTAVSIEEADGERLARAEVAPPDRGVAIGSDGRNIALARRLAARHFDIDDVRLD